MKTIGITGGVGAGKSTVLAYLEEKYNAFVIQADEVGHIVMAPGQECYQPVIDLFGKDVINLCSRRSNDRSRRNKRQIQTWSKCNPCSIYRMLQSSGSFS